MLAADEVSADSLSELIGECAAGIAEPEQWHGRVLGAYRIERELGAGGMGTVFLARRSDAEYERGRSRRSTTKWSARVEYTVGIDEIADGVVNRHRSQESRPRHAVGTGRGGGRRLANRSFMVTAVATGCAPQLRT